MSYNEINGPYSSQPRGTCCFHETGEGSVIAGIGVDAFYRSQVRSGIEGKARVQVKERPKDISFYEWRINVWRTSDSYLRLDATGRGIYRDLLDQCYAAGDFEYDPELICALCKCTPEQLEHAWKRIEKSFVKRRNGRFGNGVADIFRKNYFAYVENQRKIAKDAAAKRNGNKEIPRVPSPKPQPSQSQHDTDTIQTRNNTKQDSTEKKRAACASFEGDFERFIREYPKEVNQVAQQLFISVVNTLADERLLFANLKLYCQTDQWKRGIIPAAKTWLSEGSWKVAPKVSVPQGEVTKLWDPMEGLSD